MKNFYDAKDIMKLLDVSRATAHKRIKSMNAEMVAEGYYAEAGKVPVQLFYEKYPYLKEGVTT